MSANPPDDRQPRLEFDQGIGAELLEELRGTLDRAASLLKILEEGLKKVLEQELKTAGSRTRELEGRLARTEEDMAELASQLSVSERQTSRLMNLYVATYQLHATLDPLEVQQTIAEIVINLLGAEKFLLLLRRDEATDYFISFSQGLKSTDPPLFTGERYSGGDPLVDGTLADGVLRIDQQDSPVLAAVPLRVQGEIVGAIVILKLFDHKPSLRAEDRELLDLLSAHAASALFAARVFATKDRKLRTLESLVKLARGE
ncbi:MAG: GAF domain-containing protein [Acidobacteriota bacterium]